MKTMKTQFKKCSVVMLPIDKATIGTIMMCIQLSELHDSDIDKEIGELILNANHNVTTSNKYWQAQHLYILSDDEIKEDDLFYNPATKEVLYACKDMLSWNNDTTQEHKGWKQIIASTDTSLNLPQIPISFIKTFIKAYNEGKSIKEVMVEYDNPYLPGAIYYDEGYKSIVDQNNCISIKPLKDSYTREEVHSLMMQAWIYGEANPNKHYTFREKWIEDNL